MKKILALAAVAALATGASVYAANPFSDVSTSDWAYQAVSDLSDQGIVEGYPDGTFKGETNITRYELAQVIARLMAKEDQYTAEQRATIDKLAGEYADELDSLGVRVSNLEKKVGNISWSGDARMRYRDLGNGKDAYNGRIRINAKAQINDTTWAKARLTSGNVDFKNGKDGDVQMDRIEVHHNFGAAEVILGRHDVSFGQQVTWLYGGNAFDGISAKADLGAVDLIVGYGRFRDSGDNALNGAKATTSELFGDAEAFYAKAGADFGVAKLGVDYYKTSSFKNEAGNYGTSQVIGANLLVPVGDFRVFGDYYKDTDAAGDPQIWTAGIGYGALSLKKAGSFAIDVAYFDVEKGLVHDGMSGVQTVDDYFKANGNFWLATADVSLAKNTYLHGEYAFAHDSDDAGVADLDDSWTVSLNYKF